MKQFLFIQIRVHVKKLNFNAMTGVVSMLTSFVIKTLIVQLERMNSLVKVANLFVFCQNVLYHVLQIVNVEEQFSSAVHSQMSLKKLEYWISVPTPFKCGN